MVLLLLTGVFFISGWYLSTILRAYLEANTRCLFERWFGREKHSALNRVRQECFCGKANCQRYLTHDFKFHEAELIPEKSSEALENFFDCVLSRFILSWYRNISDDDEFIDDIKINLHFACDNLLYRLKEANAARLICRRIIPAVARHLHMCLSAEEQGCGPASGREDRLLSRLSGHLHVAMTSRAVEQRYLRALSRAIMPHLLHNTVHVFTRASSLFLEELFSVAVLVPALDVLANPDIVNKILLLLLSKEAPPRPTQPPSPLVRVLHNYHSAFRIHLDGPIPVKNVHKLSSDPVLLHQFIEYLKSLHVVDLLILFRQLEEVNSQVLQPDIPLAVKETIRRDLLVLLDSFLHSPALQLLNIPQEFYSDVRAVADGPVADVDRLQKCDSWFKAYDALYTYLDGVLLRQFFKSSFYLDLQYRNGRGGLANKSESSSKRREFSLAKLTHKVKDMFKMQSVVEGELPPGPPVVQTAEDASAVLATEVASFDERADNAEEEEVEAEAEADWQERDLSSWEISMPTISQGYKSSLVRAAGEPEESRRVPFGSSGNAQLAFVIEVRERTLEGYAQWRIHRRYQEFYVLHEKLCEFHGSHMQEMVLPPKRSFGVNKVDFLERMKPDLLLYLQKLLSKSFLHKSELLYRFLRHSELEFNSSINLGKFVKTVNLKLSKTRGQHLGGFLQSLLSSTEARKAVPRKEEDQPAGLSLRATRLHNFLFWNNAAGALRLRKNAVKKGTMAPGCDQHAPEVGGVFDALDWVLLWADSPHPYPGAPLPPGPRPLGSTASRFPVGLAWLRAVLRGLKPVLRPFVDTGLERLIDSALQEVLREHRVVPIIHLLRDILFSEESHHRSSKERQDRREAAYAAVLGLLQGAPLLFDRDRLDARLQEAFHLLQLPKLNKQLTFVLLDDLIQDLFPEVVLQEAAEEAVVDAKE